MDSLDVLNINKENDDNVNTISSKGNRRFSMRLLKKAANKVFDDVMQGSADSAAASPTRSPATPRTLKRSDSLTRKLSNLAGSLRGSLKKKLGAHIQALLSKPTKVFGQPLSEIVERERELHITDDGVPSLVTRCIEYLLPRYTGEEGLFRISGAMEDIQALRECVDKGDPIDFDSISNPHNVSGLLKLFVRELPEPLVPQDKQQSFVSIVDLESRDDQRKVLYDLISDLPVVNLRLLRRLFSMLAQIAAASDKNKMDASNLATVWGPNIFWNDKEKLETNPHKMLEWSRKVNSVVQIMIEEHEFIFKQREFEQTEQNDLIVKNSPSKKRSREEFQTNTPLKGGRRHIRSEMITSFDVIMSYNASLPEEEEGAETRSTTVAADVVGANEPERKRRKANAVMEVGHTLKDTGTRALAYISKISRRLSERRPKTSGATDAREVLSNKK